VRTVLVVAIAGNEQSLLDERPADVAAADERDDERVAQRKTLQEIADLKEEIGGVDRMANQGIRPRSTRPRSAAAKPKERPSAMKDATQITRPIV